MVDRRYLLALAISACTSYTVARMSKAESLYRLQLLDADMDAAQKRLIEIDALLKGTPALAHARSEAAKAEQALRASTSELKSAEEEVQTIDAKVSEEEQRLYAGNIRSPKEMLDVQQEVAGLKKRRAALDEVMLAAMERVEQSKTDDAACRNALAHAERNFADDNQHLRRERETLINTARGQIEQRKALSGSLPKDALDAYMGVRAKKPNRVAVTLIKNGACSQCGEVASSLLTQQARTGQNLAFCSNCGRILYVS